MSLALHAQASAAVPKPFLDAIQDADSYRNFDREARASVKEFYRLNHQYQTLDFVLNKKADYGRLNRREMGVWEALEFLNTLVDDSDPDIDLTQIDHALQTAEAIRQDGHPRWFVLTGLIHDLGKMLCFYGEPQWAVVGDTFPVGCAYSDKIVYADFFAANPDFHNSKYQTPNGIYEAGCGLDNVHLSWGHDEYLYQVIKDYVPRETAWMLRYHSCYPVHREGAYNHLLNEDDKQMLDWVRAFNPYDLYSKVPVKPNAEELKPFYQELLAEFFPAKIRW